MGDRNQSSDLDSRIARNERRHRDLSRVVLLTVVLGLVSAYVWLALRDRMIFALGSQNTPQALGDVTSFEPAKLVHNSYVSLSGVTEQRGLSQRLVRGPGPSLRRQEFWYFRLLGSRGVFVEVPPDAESFGPVTRLQVSGRVVDPRVDKTYSTLLRRYAERYHVDFQGPIRIIQVGVKPGDGRWGYLVMFVAIGLLLLMNLRVVQRYRRFMRQAL